MPRDRKRVRKRSKSPEQVIDSSNDSGECASCGAKETTQWRSGSHIDPLDENSELEQLCNSCGMQYRNMQNQTETSVVFFPPWTKRAEPRFQLAKTLQVSVTNLAKIEEAIFGYNSEMICHFNHSRIFQDIYLLYAGIGIQTAKAQASNLQNQVKVLYPFEIQKSIEKIGKLITVLEGTKSVREIRKQYECYVNENPHLKQFPVSSRSKRQKVSRHIVWKKRNEYKVEQDDGLTDQSSTEVSSPKDDLLEIMGVPQFNY